MNCLDCDKAETELLQIFKQKYNNPKGYGREYFKGNENDMIFELLQYFKNNYHIKEEVNEVEEQSENQKNNSELVNNFITDLKQDYNNYRTYNEILQ